jgi:hypothetical protein
LERDSATLPDILRLYRNDDFRKSVANGIRNETVRHFWRHEFENYPWRLRAEAVVPVQNKLGALLSDPMLYRTLVEPTVDLHFRSLMDEGGCLLVNLAKGRIGEDSALILGSLLVSSRRNSKGRSMVTEVRQPGARRSDSAPCAECW